jgi:His-Xaa-Ser system protein HxsD
MTGAPQWHAIEVDESVFSLDVVTKAVYWLTGRYTVDLRREPARTAIIVRVAHAERPLSSEEQRDVESRLRRDLVDFRTRAIVDHETRTLRDLLVAKAFAYGDES